MKSIETKVVDTVRAALIVGVFAALGFTSLAAAEDTAGPVRQRQLQQIVDVRAVHADRNEVSGVLVNLSSKRVDNVRLQIDRSWLWADERHPGENENNPGRSVVYVVPGEIPAGGQLTFTYRQDTPLPHRGDGHFETSVSVVGLEQAG